MLELLPIPAAVDASAPPEAPAPAERRWPTVSRRWRRFGAGVLLVASVGALLWWHQAVTAAPGLGFQPVGVFRSAPGDVTGITPVDNHLGREFRVGFEPGGSFMAFFVLVNDGPRPLRIEGMSADGFYYWGFEGMALSEKDRTAYLGEDYGPFHPFTLEPGETRNVRLDFRLANCDPAGLQDSGYSVVDSLPVTYNILGFRRTVSVPFDKTALTVMTIGDCDHPILPRR